MSIFAYRVVRGNRITSRHVHVHVRDRHCTEPQAPFLPKFRVSGMTAAGGQHHSKKRNARPPAGRVRTEVDPNRRCTLPSLLVVSPDSNITRLQRWRCLAHHLLADDNRGHVHTGMVILPWRFKLMVMKIRIYAVSVVPAQARGHPWRYRQPGSQSAPLTISRTGISSGMVSHRNDETRPRRD